MQAQQLRISAVQLGSHSARAEQRDADIPARPDRVKLRGLSIYAAAEHAAGGDQGCCRPARHSTLIDHFANAGYAHATFSEMLIAMRASEFTDFA